MRGIAIIGVVLYHFMFDLRLLEFVEIDVTTHPAWVFFARTLAGSFLFLVGFGLVFSHYNAMRWKSFWRRFAIIFIAAIGISIATYIFFAYMFVYFGILHAIAIFSILTLPFLRAPLWLLAVVALFIFTLPFFVNSEIFNEKIFSWIGLWQIPPITADLVPIFPSFAYTLLGVLVARLVIKKNFVTNLASVQIKGWFFKFLKKAGKLSLIIYLVHQPIMLAILYPIAYFVKPAEISQSEAFYGSCFGNCIETGGNAAYCVSYCNCALEQVEERDLWETINAPVLSEEQNLTLSSISNLCVAISE